MPTPAQTASDPLGPRPDVIVLGAGITGVAAALNLRRMGREVLLIDRVEPGSPEQTSYGNAGLLARCAVGPVSSPGLVWEAPRMLLDRNEALFLRWSHLPKLIPWLIPFLRNGTPERHEQLATAIARLTSGSIDEHLALASGTDAERFIKLGDYSFLYANRAAFEAERASHELRRRHGFPWRDVERDELHARDPALSDAYGFAITFGEHGWLTAPGKYVAALAEHYLALGGRILRAEATDLTPVEGGAAVTLQGGARVEADHVILAAGAWSRRFAEGVGHRTPLEGERGYHLMLRGASSMPPHPAMVADAHFVITPMEDGLRCAGISEWGALDAPPSAAPVELLRRRIKQVYPGLTWEAEEVWMGRRPSTVDSLPMLGAAPKAPSVIFAFGGQHVGLTIGPELGRLAAQIACGARVNADLSAIRPDRFDR
ncbi:MAG: D-amino-acid dehydrogenase [Paracoccaceae bacterium]|jgi:D-amino-acid dehydrogenase